MGAIVGDIIGSRFGRGVRPKPGFELFSAGSRPTGISVMTLACADAVMAARAAFPYPAPMVQMKAGGTSRCEALWSGLPTRELVAAASWARKPRRAPGPPEGTPEVGRISGADTRSNGDVDGDQRRALLGVLAASCMRALASGRELPSLGRRMLEWLRQDGAGPFGSFGSGGAAMVSAAGLAASDRDDASRTAETLCSLTHHHAEGTRGARGLAVAICMARDGKSTCEFRHVIPVNFTRRDFRISDVRSSYKFDATCSCTVPIAIQCFPQSTSFEEAVRSAA
ncbi:MAG: ADP-ribosylglycohydrolase family protein [Deltaproteobacteria bacterium]|nr:ADP-ribosylglycohydrolase family protein [Deltaproteobacteria bacterium]